MERIVERASRVAVHIDRLKPFITVMGWIGFALVTADYPGFIDLPVLVYIPLWIAIVASICRCALWEGVIKPKVAASLDRPGAPAKPLPPGNDEH